MSNELTFGVKLEGNSSTLVSETRAARDEFVALQKQTDALNASTTRMASGYSGLDAAVKQHNTDVNETAGSVNKLLDRYDPLGAKLRQLQSDFKALDAAAAGGKIAGRDDARVDQVYARLQADINAATAAAGNFGNVAGASMNKATLTAGQLRMATQQLPMQFTDIWVSLAAGQSPMMVMLQQGTQIKDSFGGIVPALRAMGGYMSSLVTPISLVTGAVIAGGVAWYNWGESAKEAMDKASTRLKDAEKDAKAAAGGVQRTTEEQIKALEGKRDGVTGQLEAAKKDLAGVSRETDARLALTIGQTVMARKEELRDLDRQIADLKKRQAEEENKPKPKSKVDPQQNFIDALQRESDTYGMTAGQIKIYEAAKKGIVGAEMQQVMALAEEKDARDAAAKAAQDHAKAVAEANRIISDIDPIAKATQEWEKLLALKAQGLLTDEQMGQAYAKAVGGMEDKSRKSASAMGDTWKTFADNTQRTFSDVLYNGMMGDFNGIEDAFKQMLLRLAANAAAANLTEGLFGNKDAGTSGLLGGLSKLFNADGNAFTGNGVYAFANGGAFTNQLIDTPTHFKFAAGGGFNLGVMGEAGPEAVMPLTRAADGKLGVRADVNLTRQAANDESNWMPLAASLAGIASALTIGLSGIQEATAIQFNQSNMGAMPRTAIISQPRSGEGQFGNRADRQDAGGGKVVQLTYAPTFHIDSRSDRADIEKLVDNATKRGNADLVDRLQRQGVL